LSYQARHWSKRTGIVKALAAINTADVKPFRLVFSGGTALSRAHRLTRRMSEDIDLKIVSDEPARHHHSCPSERRV
jgi:predicted nucleotidyltransferase component of viral defense system